MKIVRYAVVGFLAAVVDFVIFAVFAKWLGFNYLLVGAAGFIIATGLNYLLSIRYVFQSGVRFGVRQEVSLVFLVSALALGINQMVLYAGIGILGWEMLFVKVCATGSVFFWNFGFRARFVFHPAKADRELSPDPGQGNDNGE